MLKVIKRDCTEVDFDESKISNAIIKAMKNGSGILNRRIAFTIASEIHEENKDKDELSISEIESMVYDKLITKKQRLTAKAYEGYRSVREFQRDNCNTIDGEIDELLNGSSEYWASENSNKDEKLVTTQRDYMAGIVSKDMCKRYLLPPEIVQANDDGIIHFHDMDYFGQRTLHNCDLINLEDMLQNGTVISGTMIEKPHSFSTACNIATQIIAQVASSQYGGQTITLSHLAPFVDVSRQKIRKEVITERIKHGDSLEDSVVNDVVQERLKNEISRGVQTIQYQVITLLTTNGQAPFLSICMYLNEVEDKQTKEDLALIIEEVLTQRIQGVKNEVGVWITPAFPKLLYVLEEDNIYENSPYWHLTELAARCTAKRMVPDYISEKKMLEYKIDKNGNGNCYPCMGCRSFLTPYINKNGEPQYYGRFNQGVVTISLPDIALSSDGDVDTFWTIFDERMELCHKALQCRHERLEGTSSDVAPILWQNGALGRLKKGEKIDGLLHNGYSTLSLGYAGLYECVKYMTGNSHTDGDVGTEFAIEVMQKLNDYCNKWKAEENIDYSVYGSPIESTTYKFAKCLKKRFGIVEGITDRDYITNSYHIPVFEEIDPFEKLEIESRFQKLSPGGAISYIECADLTKNISAVLEVMKFIYDHIMYAELNTKSDYCQMCGFDGEIKIVEENGELIWECPSCKNRDKSKMNVTRRTCGYIGTNFWNPGRTEEIAERYVHLDDHKLEGDKN
ncbi:anaerobic ribonucleoside-triphosphate reductase [Lacrimispora amygdalina]|uniref:Anaerobic ribonucleoside-triphosphate reductase n=1 Tax=Lacrimispora amygdalina TaxID=253257 RepID=A0A3E2N619_9FIRM|nr:anaerobic ribonucleoside-triphosphate reductase [Clostridium indicum]RFZ76412.1 anaerobic ribonucleoside-triphosphate reductase [Clostridium indicum]